MKKLGILHVSDIHINASSKSAIDILVEKLLKDIDKVMAENNIKIHLICFAGDLIGRGDNAFEGEKQIDIAEEHFIHPLINHLGLTEHEFILVPGNHEVDRRKIAEITEEGLAAISTKEKIDKTIYNMCDEYKGRLENFYKYMYERYIPDAVQWNLGYSVERNINGINIGIVGIDSAWRSTGSGGSERGKMFVGEQQVGVLHNNIKDTDLKICLMHHPLDWLSGIEMVNVERKLNYFDLVLRGHVHDLEDKQICTQSFKTIYNTSGKLYPIDEYYSGYSILDIDMDINTCCIYSREYLKFPRDNFDKALRINENGKVEYQLTAYDESKAAEHDLKLQLKKYYEEVTEKYAMLKSVDSLSPGKVGDFFVEPTIFEKSEYERSELKNKEEKKEIPISLTDLIKGSDNVLIIAKKECGKTTILQRFGLLHTDSGSEKIPIYIDMLTLDRGKNRILIACQNFITDNLSLNMSINKQQIQNMLMTGKAIILFDNVNISNPNHILWIQDFIKNFSNNRFIFVAEENFYQTYTLKDLPDFRIEYKTVYLEYFGKNQVREMVTKWGNGKSGFDANNMTQRIVTYCNNINFAMTPFNIAVFMTIWDVDKTFIPINEGRVMRTYLETVLDKFSREDVQRNSYNYDVKQNFLGYLAYKMCKKDKYYFSLEEFNVLLAEYHEKKGFKIAKTEFDKIFFEKNILCKNGNHVYFSNTSIMEYCLATYAVSEPELYELMTAKENRSNFAHELTFYSGIVSDCSKLLSSLDKEVADTILENMNVLDEIEQLHIDIEFDIDKENFKEAIVGNRRSMEEIDYIETIGNDIRETSPMEISKINSAEESESFLNLLLIYGNVIKNAETVDKKLKKTCLKNYILGMNFQFGLIIRELSVYLTSKDKESLPDEVKEKHPNLTNEEFEDIKSKVLDLIKIIFPIALQACMARNVGTPKLEVTISELIEDNKNRRFTKFMLVFLLCDIGNGDMRSFLMKYIDSEDSKDIQKLILMKLDFYYSMWYFGNSSKTDEMLLDLITETQIKIAGSNLKIQSNKSMIKQHIKKEYNIKRNKLNSQEEL